METKFFALHHAKEQQTALIFAHGQSQLFFWHQPLVPETECQISHFAGARQGHKQGMYGTDWIRSEWQVLKGQEEVLKETQVLEIVLLGGVKCFLGLDLVEFDRNPFVQRLRLSVESLMLDV